VFPFFPHEKQKQNKQKKKENETNKKKKKKRNIANKKRPILISLSETRGHFLLPCDLWNVFL
jgi:malic enzyme